MPIDGGGCGKLLVDSEGRGNLAAPLDVLRFPRVDRRRSKPRTSSIETVRSTSGVSIVETDWATDLGVVGSIRSPGEVAVSAAGRREFKVARALLSEAGGWRTRSGGGVMESRIFGSAPEVTTAGPLFAGSSGFSAGKSLFASRALAAASRLAAACASETATE